MHVIHQVGRSVDGVHDKDPAAQIAAVRLFLAEHAAAGDQPGQRAAQIAVDGQIRAGHKVGPSLGRNVQALRQGQVAGLTQRPLQFLKHGFPPPPQDAAHRSGSTTEKPISRSIPA